VTSDLRRQGGSGRPTAELVFQLGQTVYIVRRVSGGECALWIGDIGGEPEATGATNVSRRIAQELELTWDVFKRTVFAEQKDIAALDPRATGPARRAHVEKLLGLARFKRAADQARAAVKEIQNEITGRLAELEDEEELKGALAGAERAAEEENPRVLDLKQQLANAETAYRTARKAVDKEHERAKEAALIKERRDSALAAAEAADVRCKEAKRRLAERAKRSKRLAKLQPEAKLAPAAEKELRALEELADAHRELEQARTDLASIEHDPDSAKRDEKRLEELQDERETLKTSISGLAAEIEQLERRQLALIEAASAGDPKAVQVQRDRAGQEERRLDREVELLRRQIDEDEQHIAAVRSGGPATQCPVCRRPYGDDYEQILAAHEAEIAGAEARLPDLDAALAAASTAREDADDRLARARDAQKALSRTEGPSNLHACSQRLGAGERRRAQIQGRLEEVATELLPLQTSVRASREVGKKWASAHAIVLERQRRFARAAKAADAETYDPAAHEAARQRSERLSAVADVAEELERLIAEARGVERQLADAMDQAQRQRQAVAQLTDQFMTIGLKKGELDRRQAVCQQCEQRRDGLRDELEQARLAAQGRSQEVKDLRRRLRALRRALGEVQRRRVELRQYQVVADVLEQYRQHESQRAWPQLQQGASALLAAATGGRYADIRLSADYKLTIVDRGQEHGLARYSGGEQDLANLCLRLAIAEWVAKERGTDISLVILDEVFGSQDDERRRLLLDQLRSLSTRFRQMLIVTHVADIADLCDARIEVSIDEVGTSKAVVAG
jgi:DNA repair protein SbcC/Rad50